VNYLSIPELGEVLFNNYIYNTMENISFNKTPIVGQENLDKIRLKSKDKIIEKPKSTTDKKEADPEPAPRPSGTEDIYEIYRYLMRINQNHIVEVLFVFSSLLSGKRKADIQSHLLKYDFIKRLSVLFSLIKWKQFPSIVLN